MACLRSAFSAALVLLILGSRLPAVEVLGGGTDALVGNDLTDVSDNGMEGNYNPPDLGGFDATFFSSDEPGFGGGEFAFNVFDNRLDGANSKWCCGTVFPQIVGADFGGVQHRLAHFTVSSANDFPDRDPRVWRIEGSNTDAFGPWTTIFSQADLDSALTALGRNPGDAIWTARLQVIRFEHGIDYPTQTTGYSLFRMVTEETAGALFQIGEIEFFDGAEDQEVCFRRGDANSDGRASIADLRAIALLLASEGPAPPCLEALDVDDSGVINITDLIILFDGLFLGAMIPAPYPNPGLDPTPDALGCEAYGVGAPLEDPAARLRLLDAYVLSGRDTQVSLTIAATSAAPTAGFSADIALAFPMTTVMGVEVLAGELPPGAFETATLENGSIHVACHHCYLGPGGPTPLLRIDAAIAPDIEPGDYEMTFSSGELVDAATGRAILPNLWGGVLHVAALACDGGLSVASISSGSSANGMGAALSGRIIGSGFDERAQFRLDGPESIPASEAIVVSSCNAEVVFDVEGAAPGVYDLVAARAGGESATLASAVTIAATVLGPVVDAWLSSPERVRYDRLFTASLHCRNRGDRETIAPLVRLRAPEGFELGVAADGVFQGNELLVLALDAKGIAGILPPGIEVEVPILLRPVLTRCPPAASVGESGCDPFPSAACTECKLRLEVAVLSADEGDFVGWDLLAESSGEAWAGRWRELSSILAGSWRDVHASLASIATRLSRRGEPAASVRRLFRYAVRQAMGLPSAAALGQVTDSAGVPLAGVDVRALDGERVASSARTDRFGTFALDWLAPGRSYGLALGLAPSVGAPFAVPAQGDLVNVKLVGTPDGGVGALECANCDETGLPDRPLPIPDALFTPRADLKVSVLSAWDPNDKEGPDGDGGLLRTRSWVEYTIDFENLPTASLPARQVVIEDELDERILDLSTLQVTNIQIGDRPEQAWSNELDTADRYSGYASTAVVGASSAERQFQIVQQPEGQEEVTIQVTYNRLLDTSDPERPKLVLFFETLSDDSLQGFLLPNDPDGLRQGEGHVTFAVQVKDDAEIPDDSDELRNKAGIRFDALPLIETLTWVNRIYRSAPPEPARYPAPASGAVLACPASTTLLQWAEVGGVGYELRFWTLGDPRPVEGILLDDSFYKMDSGTLEEGRTYNWDVITRGENGSTASSGPWSFTVQEALPAPEAASNPEPADGAAGVSLPLRLNWSDVAGAASYTVMISDARDAKRSFPGLARSELDGITGLAPGTPHTWSIDAFNAAGSATHSAEWRFTTAGEVEVPFVRGDSNGDGRNDISDAVSILGFLFIGSPAQLDCPKAADTNDNGKIDISDAVYLLGYRFLGGPPPPSPFEECGIDATPDALACDAFDQCP